MSIMANTGKAEQRKGQDFARFSPLFLPHYRLGSKSHLSPAKFSPLKPLQHSWEACSQAKPNLSLFLRSSHDAPDNGEIRPMALHFVTSSSPFVTYHVVSWLRMDNFLTVAVVKNLALFWPVAASLNQCQLWNIGNSILLNGFTKDWAMGGPRWPVDRL